MLDEFAAIDDVEDPAREGVGALEGVEVDGYEVLHLDMRGRNIGRPIVVTV